MYHGWTSIAFPRISAQGVSNVRTEKLDCDRSVCLMPWRRGGGPASGPCAWAELAEWSLVDNGWGWERRSHDVSGRFRSIAWYGGPTREPDDIP